MFYLARLGVLLSALAVIVGTALGWSAYQQGVNNVAADARSAAPPPDRSPDKQESEDRLTVVTVIGDSYTQGSSMNTGPTWIERLAEKNDWFYVSRADGGAGFVGDRAYSERNPAALIASDLIIIAGGRNDLTEDFDVVMDGARETVDDALAATTGDVVMFSPFANAQPDGRTYPLAAALAKLAKKRDIPYFDVTDLFIGRPELIGADGTHPVNAGHAYMAERIGAWLRAQGVPRADAWRAGSSTRPDQPQ